MARGRSPLAAKVPAVVNADKAVAQWKSLRREHGDDRVATDLGFIPADLSVSGGIFSAGTVDASFAQSSLTEMAAAEVEGMTTVVEAAESGVLIADVSKWGAIAVWLLAWVQSMIATVANTSEDNTVESMLKWIYGNLQKKAGEGTRLAIIRADVDESRPCFQHSDRDNVVLRGECHQPHEDFTLVPYNGPADMVDGIVYSSLMEMGRAYANDPWLDPEQAQFVAVRIIATRRWKDMRIRAAQNSHEESLDVLQALGTSLQSAVFRFTRDDHAITSATDCEVRDRDGQVLRVIPAITEVTEVPNAPEALRTPGIEYHESHWKGDTRAAETRALSDISRIELVKMIIDGVRDGIILTDKRTGEPMKDAVMVCTVAALLFDLRAADSLRARSYPKHSYEEQPDQDRQYRNLTPNEIAHEITEMLGHPVTRYQVNKALEICHFAEDAYWHFIHVDSGEEIRLSCHVCNAEHHEHKEVVRERRQLARQAMELLESRVKVS